MRICTYNDAHFVQVILFTLDKSLFVNNPAFMFLSITIFFSLSLPVHSNANDLNWHRPHKMFN